MKHKIEQSSPTQPQGRMEDVTAEEVVDSLISELDARIAGERGPMPDDMREGLIAERDSIIAAIRADPERARRMTLDFLREEGLL